VVTVRLLVISTTPEPEIWRNMVLYKTPSWDLTSMEKCWAWWYMPVISAMAGSIK
jgi:hypothetical protein